MTRSGAGIAEIQKNAKATSQYVGVKTIVCGLKSRIRDTRLADWMKEHAVHVGVWRHFVSLVANEILLSSDEMPVIENWFLWYTQVWSALQYHVIPRSGMSSKNPLIDDVRRVLDQHPSMASTLLETKAPRVMTRQQD